MSLNYLLGLDDRLKREHLYHRIFLYLKRNPDHQIFYIVPENVKFDAEQLLLRSLKDYQHKNWQESVATTQIQVTSFKRLAWYFLQHETIYQQTRLTETGMTMIMRQVLEEEKDNLQIYRGEVAQNGFISKMVDQIDELRKGEISPHYLYDLIEKNQIDHYDTELKLHDLWIIYTAFMKKISSDYILSEDIYHHLSQKIAEVNLSQSLFIIDHYDSFSASEIQLVTAIAKHAKELWLPLLMDNSNRKAETKQLNDPERTYMRLEQIARDEKIITNSYMPQDWLVNDTLVEFVHPDLNKFLNYWQQLSNYKVISPETAGQIGSDIVQIWQGADHYGEILHVANKIKQLVATNKFRYRDFQILTRDIESYELAIKQIFENSDIPYFIDQTSLMSQHPFIEAIELIMKLATEGPRSRVLVELLRTGLIQPFNYIKNEVSIINQKIQEKIKQLQALCCEFLQDDEAGDEQCWRLAVDILENSVLAYGIDFNDWLSDEPWYIERQNAANEDEIVSAENELSLEEKITESMRTIIQDLLIPLLKSFKDCHTNQELATHLYKVILTWQMDAELKRWRDQLLLTDKVAEAERNEQVWSHFIQILDEYVLIFGDESADLANFRDILSIGFENAYYGMVPPTMDQVQISHFDRPGIKNYAGVFIIGLTNTTLPQQTENKTILSEGDREWLSEQILADERLDAYLAPSSVQRSINETYLAYKAFSQARQFLILSYPQKSTENDDLQMSPYLEQIKDSLQIPIFEKTAHSLALESEQMVEQLSFVGSLYYAHDQILLNLRRCMVSEEQNPFWQALYTLLRDAENLWQNRIYGSLSYKNIPEHLSKETVEKLYSKELYLSVSQLESYFADPYSHFLTYGLRAKPRLKQELTPLEIGSFYHEALDYIIEKAAQDDLLGNQQKVEELNNLTQKTLHKVLDLPTYSIFQKSARMNFVSQKLTRDIWHNVLAISKQNKWSQMKPALTEVIFGPLGANQKMRGLTYPLDRGGQIHLRGKIDRLDQMNIDGRNYINIVDYKSSKRSFNWSQVYSGLMMQLIVYMHTAMKNKADLFQSDDILPAGIFYSEIGERLLKAKEVNQSEISDALLKEFKYNGYVIGEDEEMVDALDQSDYDGDYSTIYPLYKKKNGHISPGSSHVMTLDQWQQLTEYIEHLIVKAGNSILSGQLSIAPYEDMNYIPSLNEYKAIAQFDALLPENNYRHLPKFSSGAQKARNQFFDRISDKLSQEGN